MEEGGVEALLAKNRRVPNRKNREDERIEKHICEMAIENPALGQARVSNELRKESLCISPGGVLSEAQLAALESKQQDVGKLRDAHPGYLGSQDTFYVGTTISVGRV
jgi:hypothetical protein